MSKLEVSTNTKLSRLNGYNDLSERFHMGKLHQFILILVVALLTGCQATQPTDNTLRGTITLWHSWSEEEAKILEQIVGEFLKVNPDVNVNVVAFPPERILEQFTQAGEDGLGPDLLLGSSDWIPKLADGGLLREIKIDDQQFENTALKVSGYQDKVYGLPISFFPQATFYNRDLVDQPPSTLEDLLSEAEAGKVVAINQLFEDSYWGIQAFGEGLFDEQGNFSLVDSGLIEWFEWLHQAQNESGFILSNDIQGMQDLFTRGEIAYYISGSQNLAGLMAGLGEDKLGVNTLPSGEHGPAGPLLLADAILFFAHSSPEQIRISNALANFIVSPKSNISFIRLLNRVPANPNVQVDSRLYPEISKFVQQTKSGVYLPSNLDREQFFEAGTRALTKVLSNIQTADEAACSFASEIINFQNYAPENVRLPAGCEPNVVR